MNESFKGIRWWRPLTNDEFATWVKPFLKDVDAICEEVRQCYPQIVAIHKQEGSYPAETDVIKDRLDFFFTQLKVHGNLPVTLNTIVEDQFFAYRILYMTQTPREQVAAEGLLIAHPKNYKAEIRKYSDEELLAEVSRRMKK